jgi:hypothetical protein
MYAHFGLFPGKTADFYSLFPILESVPLHASGAPDKLNEREQRNFLLGAVVYLRLEPVWLISGA